MITDSHTHLCWQSFEEDREAVIERARAAGVGDMLVVGVDVESSRAGRALCEGRDGLHWTAGLHPSSSEEFSPTVREALEALCAEPGCAAVGETGLDYFKMYAAKEVQRAAFEWQLGLALELDKPVVIHCRDAHDEVAAMLPDHAGLRGVLHCFTMGPDELAPYLEAGLSISFSGTITYPRNRENLAAAREVPIERLLIETDSPWLAPVPHRGERNEPAFVRDVLACLAQARGVDALELGRATRDNASRLFGF